MLWITIYTYFLCHLKWLFFKVSILWCFILLFLPEKLNINLSKLAELHASLLINNMNVVKYVKQLQCHLADMEYKKKSTSERWIVGVYKLSFYFTYGLCNGIMSISDYISSNCRMGSQWWIERYMEGQDCGLILGTIRVCCLEELRKSTEETWHWDSFLAEIGTSHK